MGQTTRMWFITTQNSIRWYKVTRSQNPNCQAMPNYISGKVGQRFNVASATFVRHPSLPKCMYYMHCLLYLDSFMLYLPMQFHILDLLMEMGCLTIGEVPISNFWNLSPQNRTFQAISFLWKKFRLQKTPPPWLGRNRYFFQTSDLLALLI